MIIDVLIYRIEQTFYGSWATDSGMVTLLSGNYLHVLLDDSDNSLSVLYTDSSVNGGGTDLGTLSGAGPNLYYNGVDGSGVPYPGRAALISSSPYYQWCDGTTLRKIGTLSGYPYGGVQSYPGASECVIAPVCDLEISSIYTTVPATGPANNDGSLTVTAVSSNGVIRLSLTEDFEYSTGQTSGIFEDLLPGAYTVYAKDEIGCIDSIDIEVTITEVYGVRHRLDFRDSVNISRKYWRIDILERAYTGEIEEMWCGDVPAVIRYEGDRDDPSLPLVPSNFVVNVLVQTNSQYTHLHTSDDRKYKGIIYCGEDVDSLDIYCIGYGIPEFHSEPYIFEPYPLEVTFSDGLGELKNKDFEDINGNPIRGTLKAINVVAEVLKHTGLALPIRCGINIFEENMISGGEWETEGLVPFANFGSLNTSSEPMNWTYDPDEPYLTFATGMAPGAMSDIYFPVPEIDYEGGRTHTIHLAATSQGSPGEAVTVQILLLDNTNDVMLVTNVDGISQFSPLSPNTEETVNILFPVGVKRVAYRVMFPNGTADDGVLTINLVDDITDPIEDDSNDPLNQIYIDTRIFSDEPTKCDEVLKRIAEVFRAQIFQSMGYWWIIRLSDSTGAFIYRQFDSDGNLEELATGNFEPLIELDFPMAVQAAGKLMFTEQKQILSFLRNYGTFTITNDLRKDGNLIDEGRFEEEDVINLGSGNKAFKNWSVTLGQAGVTCGLEVVDNGDSKGAFFFDYNAVNSDQNDTTVYSTIIPVDNEGRIRFKFQYMVTPKYDVPYIRLAWGLKIIAAEGEFWLTYGTNGAITYEDFECRNEIYVSSFNSWETFDILATFSDNPFIANIPLDVTDVQIFFWFHNHYGRDFESIADFKAFAPSSLSSPGGTKRMVPDDVDGTRVYTCEYLPDASESDPDLILPNSYNNASGNLRWVWRLDKILDIGPNAGFVDRIKLDNVSLGFYPKVMPNSEFIDPVETLSYSQTVSRFVDSTFDKQVLLGDMIRYDETAFRNEPRLYRSYLRFQDGTPTQYWARAGVTESKRLLSILLDDLIAQFSEPQRKLSAAFISTKVFHFVNAMRDNLDGSRYRPMTMEFDIKNAAYTMDLAGVIGGVDGEPPAVLGEFNDDYNEDFNIGE